MSLPSCLNPADGSLLAPKWERNHCALRHPDVYSTHHSHRKFLLRCGSSNPNSVWFWRVGAFTKRCVCRVQPVAHLKLQSTKSLALSSFIYEQDEEEFEKSEMLVHAERVEEGIHMLMAEENFDWEPKSTFPIDLKAKPASDTIIRSCVDALDQHRGSSSGRIQSSIFHEDGIELGKRYQKMIGEDPRNAMLLRNYGRYLYEFKGNRVAAEKCYLPALLLDPENGQFLAEYAAMTWELYHAESITKYFFERAVKSSPNDSFVHAAYARFLFQIDDDEE